MQINPEHKTATAAIKNVAKNYFNSLYGIPAITFEVGDNTDRETIINSSKNLADSMMLLLLENK